MSTVHYWAPEGQIGQQVTCLTELETYLSMVTRGHLNGTILSHPPSGQHMIRLTSSTTPALTPSVPTKRSPGSPTPPLEDIIIASRTPEGHAHWQPGLPSPLLRFRSPQGGHTVTTLALRLSLQSHFNSPSFFSSQEHTWLSVTQEVPRRLWLASLHNVPLPATGSNVVK